MNKWIVVSLLAMLMASASGHPVGAQPPDKVRRIGSLSFELGWNEGLAEELVRLQVDVILAWTTAAARAAKNATRTIPIVMALSADPIGTGLNGAYVSFAGATFSPRPAQQPHPPIWVGGSPGAVSGPAVRRCAALGDAWHPLALSLEEIERGYATRSASPPATCSISRTRRKAAAARRSRVPWPRWCPTSAG